MTLPVADSSFLSSAGSPTFFVSPNTRSLIHLKDGGVLFNIDKGKCFSLNSVGAEIWKIVEHNSINGFTQNGVIHSLSQRYELPITTIQADVLRFLNELETKGFIVSASEIKTRPVSGAIPIIPANFTDNTPPPPRTAAHADFAPKPSQPPRAKFIPSCLAFLFLIAADIVLKAGGFRKLHSIIREFPVRVHKRRDELTVGEICAAADRATRWYLKPTWCLQRSAATICILRFYGIEGHLAIGCNKLPFQAHAWVEVESVVVNDRPDIKTFYKTIDLL